jgi:hypothetical protein
MWRDINWIDLQCRALLERSISESQWRLDASFDPRYTFETAQNFAQLLFSSFESILFLRLPSYVNKWIPIVQRVLIQWRNAEIVETSTGKPRK